MHTIWKPIYCVRIHGPIKIGHYQQTRFFMLEPVRTKFCLDMTGWRHHEQQLSVKWFQAYFFLWLSFFLFRKLWSWPQKRETIASCPSACPSQKLSLSPCWFKLLSILQMLLNASSSTTIKISWKIESGSWNHLGKFRGWNLTQV